MDVLAGSQVTIQFLNHQLAEITGTVINVLPDALRIEVEATQKHLFVLKTAIASIEILD